MKKAIGAFVVICIFITLLYGIVNKQALYTKDSPQIEKTSLVLLPAESSEANFSTFSVSPTSWDFGERCVVQHIPAQFNLAVHNTGGGTESGQVQIYPFNGFTCVAGCSYSLGPNQSQYVTIRFEPPAAGSFNATAYFTYSGGYVQAALSGEGTWDQPPCQF